VLLIFGPMAHLLPVYGLVHFSCIFMQSVGIFKKLLKTHLLRAAYGDTIYIYDLKLFLIIIIFGHVQSVGIF